MNCLKMISVSYPGSERKHLVPCGRCEACLSNKANDWVTRLRAETFASSSAFFITLTYEDHFLPFNRKGHAGFSLSDMQRFIKNLRNKVPDQIRYYYVCEYGENFGRPHYHMILWNWPPEVDLMTACGKSWLDSKGRMMSFWLPEQVKPLTTEHILYVSKYIHKKQLVPPDYDKPFMRCSRRPGIGASLISDQRVMRFYREAPTSQVFVDGEMFYMSRYYKDKIYNTPELKEQLLLTKARYVATKSDKQMKKDLRQIGVAYRTDTYVSYNVDPETGEITGLELKERRPRPVGLLEKSGLLVKRALNEQVMYKTKNKQKIVKSFKF